MILLSNSVHAQAGAQIATHETLSLSACQPHWLKRTTRSMSHSPIDDECLYLIGRAQAHEYLKHATEAWTPGEEFKRILTSGSEWNWRLYLASSQWGKELLADGVAEFWRVWHGRGQHGRAVFYCKTQDDRELVIRPFAKPECSEDLHAGIRWHV